MDIDTFPNLPALFLETSSREPEREVYAQAQIGASEGRDFEHAPPRAWHSRTYREVRERVARVAGFLRALGLQPGDAAAIVSTTRPEWMESDLGILSAGGISVSVYPTLTAPEVGYLLYDSGARVVFVENQEQLDKLAQLLRAPCPIPATEERAETTAQITLRKVVSFEQVDIPEGMDPTLVTTFSELLGSSPIDDFSVVNSISRDTIASLVYTSGTTGPPKGVIQTHGNHLANIRQAGNCGVFGDDTIFMLFLPLAHAFAKLVGYLGFLTPASLRFPAIVNPRSSKLEPNSISKDIREAGFEITPVVPRLLEKMMSGVLEKAHGPGLVGKLLSAMLWAAQERYRALQAGKSVPLSVALTFALTKPLRKKVRRQLFGERFKYAISGGAKLNPEVNEFFQALEIVVLEGYGLTETVVATNVNRFGAQKIGTVGPVLDHDIEMRVAADGEIQFRGPNVAKGYYNRPTATAQSWSADGWFSTGDLGSIDADGFLTITGRKKELIVTANGKKVPPDPIEQKLKRIELIAQAVLVGEGKSYCCALFTLNREVLDVWAQKRGITLDVPPHEHPVVRDEIQRQLHGINAELANFEQVKRFRLLPEDFTVENGFLTPTFKVKRREVTKRFGALIEEMYAEGAGS